MVKRKGDGKSQKQQNPRKEDANMAVTEVLTEFSYMVEDQFVLGDDVQEILLASIPTGYAILDTGCTTSVVGEVVLRLLLGKILQLHIGIYSSKVVILLLKVSNCRLLN